MKLGFNEANDRFCKNHSVMMDLELCEKYGFDCIDIQSECLNRDLEAGKITLEEMGAWFQSHHLKMLSYNALCFFNMKQTQEEKDAVMAELDEIIRRCNIHNCEQTGIVGRMGAVYSVIENNHIHHINNMQELGGAEISGIKLHAAIDVVIRRNHIHDCTMGVWCDWEAQGTRITQNLLHHNERPAYCTWAVGGMESQDIFVEVGHGPTLIDNNIMMSKVSLRFATQGVALVHNLMLGTFLRRRRHELALYALPYPPSHGGRGLHDHPPWRRPLLQQHLRAGAPGGCSGKAG